MIQNLPTEIIDKVFGYLEEKEKLILAQVNKRLECTYAYHVKEKYRCLFVREDINSPGFYTDTELRVILSSCGSTVNFISIQCTEVMDQLGELIEKYCINLRYAYLMINNENFNAFKRVLNKTCIETLNLDSFHYRGTDLIQYVNPYCKDLKLERISMAQEHHIRQLIHLEKLYVESYYVRNIFEICSHLPKLREFTTTCFEYPTDLKQDYLYPELETLTLQYFEIKLDLPICPKLKQLMLIFTVSYVENIGDIISKYGNTLEYLDLSPSMRSKQ
ncbi:uncharacterized protein LOC108156599 [Drosophila miranda]|uniref:uncharacterized protein LOC108156599 n=1 Tax=Drosophila miranda TaxID=7229 RepID=UPI00143F9AB3|nr:uncharacterized protein LOC108156599 [Drosophila miranda]